MDTLTPDLPHDVKRRPALIDSHPVVPIPAFCFVETFPVTAAKITTARIEMITC